jgi:hypothetical protein
MKEHLSSTTSRAAIRGLTRLYARSGRRREGAALDPGPRNWGKTKKSDLFGASEGLQKSNFGNFFLITTLGGPSSPLQILDCPLHRLGGITQLSETSITFTAEQPAYFPRVMVVIYMQPLLRSHSTQSTLSTLFYKQLIVLCGSEAVASKASLLSGQNFGQCELLEE